MLMAGMLSCAGAFFIYREIVHLTEHEAEPRKSSFVERENQRKSEQAASSSLAR